MVFNKDIVAVVNTLSSKTPKEITDLMNSLNSPEYTNIKDCVKQLFSEIPNTLSDVDDLNVPSFISPARFIPAVPDSLFPSYYEIPMLGDIVSRVIVVGKNIRKVVLLSGDAFYNSSCDAQNIKIIKPFSTGFILHLLQYSKHRVEIDADRVDNVWIQYLLLSNPDRSSLLEYDNVSNDKHDKHILAYLLDGSSCLLEYHSSYLTRYDMYKTI